MCLVTLEMVSTPPELSRALSSPSCFCLCLCLCLCHIVFSYHMSCDFGDGEDASMAFESLILSLSFPLQSRLGTPTLHPDDQYHDQDNDHDDHNMNVVYDHDDDDDDGRDLEFPLGKQVLLKSFLLVAASRIVFYLWFIHQAHCTKIKTQSCRTRQMINYE